MKNINETRIKNGPVVLSDKMDGVRSVSLGIFCRLGSANEPIELNGISHFIEHCVFKGTAKRTALEIAIEQDKLGGNLEAFTTHEEIGFAAKVIDTQLNAAFGLLAEMLTEPSFEINELKNEQRVIIEEIKMTEDSPEEYLSELFYKKFYAGHPFGKSIAGTPRSVRSFDKEKTAAYHKQIFAPENLVVVAAGNIEHKEIVRLTKKYFSPKKELLNVTSDHAPIREILPAPPKVSTLLKQKEDLEQVQLIIAAPLFGERDQRRYASDLLANILGGGMSSRLWQEIREKRGLAYSVYASAAMFRDSGFFSVYAAVSPKQANETIKIVIAELKKVMDAGVTADELELAKDQARTALLLAMEDSASRAASLAHSELLHGRQIMLEETLANLEAVTTDDLQKIAAEFFTPKKLTLAALGDLRKTNISIKNI